MNLTIRAFKSRGIRRDGPSWSCTLYVDGIKAAAVLQEGRGGETEIDWSVGPDKSRWGGPLAARVAAYVATLPEEDAGFGLGPMEQDLESVVAKLADEYENTQRIRRSCKTKTLFRTADQKQNEYMVMSRPFSPAIAEALRAKHPGVVILNETVSS